MFFGTSAFAVPALRAFASATRCELVVTQPDRPAGRGHRLVPTEVKRAAHELGLPVAEPVRLRELEASLRALAPELFAVASYGKIVPQALLDLPTLGALNVHPSLLPLYRGATPLQSQLRDGVRASGVTIIAMDAGTDTGDIVVQRIAEVGSDEIYGTLHDRFAEIGAELLAEAVRAVCDGSARPRAQAGLASAAEIERTATRPWTKADWCIDDDATARAAYDRYRALAPQPMARIAPLGEPLKVAAARFVAAAPAVAAWPPGAWSAPPELEGAIVRSSADGAFIVERVVPPNRGAMAAATYLRDAAGRTRA